jgi:hypothetical protein
LKHPWFLQQKLAISLHKDGVSIHDSIFHTTSLSSETNNRVICGDKTQAINTHFIAITVLSSKMCHIIFFRHLCGIYGREKERWKCAHAEMEKELWEYIGENPPNNNQVLQLADLRRKCTAAWGAHFDVVHANLCAACDAELARLGPYQALRRCMELSDVHVDEIDWLNHQ